MGSSKSKSTSNSNSNSSTEHKSAKPVDVTKFEKLVKEANTSTKDDPSFSNIIAWFSDLLQKPDLEGFGKAVNGMKDNWDNIFKALDELSADSYYDDVNNDDVRVMKSIYNDYWKLLLKTRTVMCVLIKKCELQQSNVLLFLEIIDKCFELKDDEELSKRDKANYLDCKSDLSDWVTTAEFEEIIQNWIDLQLRLAETQLSWDEKCKKVKRAMITSWNRWTNVGLAVGIAVALTGSIVVAVLTCGLFTVHSGVRMICKLGQAERSKMRVICLMNDVARRLTEMMADTQTIQYNLNSVHQHQTLIATDFKQQTKNKASLEKIQQSLKRIHKHLEDYIMDGRQVMQTVDNACKTVIS